MQRSLYFYLFAVRSSGCRYVNSCIFGCSLFFKSLHRLQHLQHKLRSEAKAVYEIFTAA